jgi:hypothetical protein
MLKQQRIASLSLAIDQTLPRTGILLFLFEDDMLPCLSRSSYSLLDKKFFQNTDELQLKIFQHSILQDSYDMDRKRV